jgi:hypothetical protein
LDADIDVSKHRTCRSLKLQQPMTTDGLSKQPDNAIPFLLARAQAIDAYAQVERWLNFLFSNLLGTPHDIGGIVFFRITNSSSRLAIIDSLFEKRHGNRFEGYWSGLPNTPNRRGLVTLVRQLDTRRNEIVHWHTVNYIETDGQLRNSNLFLQKPNFWGFFSDSQSITVEEMEAFISKADFTSRSIMMLVLYISGQLDQVPETKQQWHNVFLQPCLYPPSGDHPLSPNASKDFFMSPSS